VGFNTILPMKAFISLFFSVFFKKFIESYQESLPTSLVLPEIEKRQL